ncbi:MAG TPA: AAA family ATPase [Candidatus Paceibacterota bacterium]
MTIQKIQHIKKYKSFRDYSWQPFLNNENFHEEVNILYGENGCGKTSVCNILKSVSQNKNFSRYFPEEVGLLIDDTEYKYENKLWTSSISNSSILFFDREFVDKNVHTGRDRGTQQGEQEQESGKLIIEFDGEAIKLREVRDALAKTKDEHGKTFDDFKRSNTKTLSFELTDEEEVFFRKHKSKSKSDLKKLKETLEEQKSELGGSIKSDQKLLQKATEIQSLEELEEPDASINFSQEAGYQKVFDFDLKEQVKIKAEEELIRKIKEHKDFFEAGFEIRKIASHECPFCQAKDKEENITEIIRVYNQIYDDSYRKQKAAFDSYKRSLTDELKEIQETLRNLNLDNIFIRIKRFSEQYSIKELYSLEEEEGFRKKRPTQKIDELEKKISGLEKPSKENISALYGEVSKEVKSITELLAKLIVLVEKKNELIKLFKKEHTSKKLVERMGKASEKLGGIKSELAFIDSSKIDNQKLKLEKDKELNKLTSVFEKSKEEHKSAREKYEEYCSREAFEKTLKRIQSYFKNFNFNFQLKLDTSNRHTGSTKEFPFAFRVVDPDGNERDLKEGLSEGEMQVLSLCFFFAWLDIQNDKDQKVLVFDDPITSLDDSNLSSLVDLIADEKKKFSQIFILTHHRTFFKFLRKRFDKHSAEYNIVRNKGHLGGSFICKSMEGRFIQRLQEFETHLVNLGKNPAGFDIELQIVEYGQYLRYETEYFIKCRLLHWNESNEFGKVIEGIKENKKVSNTDLDTIKKIYSFCNWTTSHVDVGDDHGLSQLKEKITDFIGVSDKY